MIDPDRLAAIGLPPRPEGWVPEQPGLVVTAPAAADPASATTDAASGSALDGLRLMLAARLPLSLGAKLEQASNRAFTVGLTVVVGLVLVVVMKMHGHHQAGYGGDYSSSFRGGAAAAPSVDVAAAGSSIVVDVGGRVRHPGLVTLPLGARVADAIRAAGGPLRRRELSRIDLAARVTDGQLLMVGTRSADPAASQGSSAPVSLSTASLAELETLPGVGPVTAQKIIDWRTAHGGFAAVSQLQQVSGIGPARYAQLSPLVTP